MGGVVGVAAGRGDPGRPLASGVVAVGHAVHRALAAGARRGVGDQPALARRRRRAADGGRDTRLRATARRTWHFFETFVGVGRPSPPAGQLPGGPRTGGGASHVADQHRPLSPLHRRGPRLRMARAARRRRTPRAQSRHHAPSRALPRPPLQLVRNQRAAPARPEVRVHGRQRQPRGPPAHAAGGVPRAGRSPAARPAGAHRRRRHDPGAARGAALPRGRPPDAHRLAQGPRRGARRPRRGARPGPHVAARLGHPPRRPSRRTPMPWRTSRARCARSVATPAAARWSRGRKRSVQRSPATRATSTRCFPGCAGASRLARSRRRPACSVLPTPCDALDVACPTPSGTEPPAVAQSRAACTDIDRRLATLRRTADGMASGMDFEFLFDPTRNLFRDRLPRGQRRARSQLLRPAGVRGAPGELRRDREGRRAADALVPPGTRDDAGRSRLRPRVVVGIDVRVPDAGAGDACARRQPPRPDVPPRRPSPDPVRLRTRRPVGHLGIGVQRPRPRPHLSVLELRRSRARPRARPQRRPRRGTLCHGAGRDDGRIRGGAEPRAAHRGRRTRSLWLLRGARLHHEPRAGRRDDGAGPRLHGPPPGHDRGRPAERAARRSDAPALSRRAHRAGERPPAPGAHAAGRRRHPPTGRRGEGGAPRPRFRAARATSDPFTRTVRSRTPTSSRTGDMPSC